MKDHWTIVEERFSDSKGPGGGRAVRKELNGKEKHYSLDNSYMALRAGSPQTTCVYVFSIVCFNGSGSKFSSHLFP